VCLRCICYDNHTEHKPKKQSISSKSHSPITILTVNLFKVSWKLALGAHVRTALYLISSYYLKLRNLFSPQAVFLYFIINLLWVVATFFLQAIGSDIISIKIPKHTIGSNSTDEYLKVGTWNTHTQFKMHTETRHSKEDCDIFFNNHGGLFIVFTTRLSYKKTTRLICSS